MLIVAIVFLLLFFINAPYGRYKSRSWGFLVNANFMRFAMEFPAAVFHFLFWATLKESGLPIHVFVPLLQMHDLHRSIIFPLLMWSSAILIPMVVGLVAIFFDSLNSSGLDQFAESQRDLSDFRIQKFGRSHLVL
jgi:hypothetical protein